MKLIENWNGYTTYESGYTETDWHRPEGKNYRVRATMNVDVERHAFRNLYFYFVPDGYWSDVITLRISSERYGSNELHASLSHSSGGRCDESDDERGLVGVRDDLDAERNFAIALANAADLGRVAIAEINEFFANC